MLTEKQKRFCDEYIIDLDPIRAYQKIYKSKESTAKVNAYRLLEKASVSEYIASKQKKIEEKLELSAEWVLKRLVELNDRCMQGTPVIDREGNETGEWKFEANAANRSLELIGKHLGMFTDKVESKVTAENTNVIIDNIPEEEKLKLIKKVAGRLT